MKACAFILLLMVASISPSFGAPIFTWESADRADIPEVNGALVVGKIQFVAARIEIVDIIHVTSIGATMFSLNEDGTFFAAILQLQGSTSLPVGSPFDGTELLATIFNAGETINDYYGTTDLVLNPGHYAIIIGGGEFGATGSGGLSSNNIDHPWASFFLWTDVDPIIPFGEHTPLGNGSWSESDFGGYRIFLEGTVIPEPSTGIMLLFGFLAIWIRKEIAQPETGAYP